MKTIDLSQVIKTGMQVFPGDPEVTIKEELCHESDYCHVDYIHMGSHTGTHIDAPYHFIKDGKRITDFPTDKFVGNGVVIDVTQKCEDESIEIHDVRDYEINSGDFVIFHSGFSAFFGTDKYIRHPYISGDTAMYLANKDISIIGVDFLNVDPTHYEKWDAHPIFLSKDILIVENLTNLNMLKKRRSYIFSFMPLNLADSDGSPIRAYATLAE